MLGEASHDLIPYSFLVDSHDLHDEPTPTLNLKDFGITIPLTPGELQPRIITGPRGLLIEIFHTPNRVSGVLADFGVKQLELVTEKTLTPQDLADRGTLFFGKPGKDSGQGICLFDPERLPGGAPLDSIVAAKGMVTVNTQHRVSQTISPGGFILFNRE